MNMNRRETDEFLEICSEWKNLTRWQKIKRIVEFRRRLNELYDTALLAKEMNDHMNAFDDGNSVIVDIPVVKEKE